MTEAEFAEELYRALGPIYRIQVTDEEGQTLVAYGRGPGSNRPMAKISLPNSVNALLIGIDLDAIVAADRLLHELAEPHTLAGSPLGALEHLDEALDQLIAQGEAQLGRPLEEMSRTEKQKLVRFLDDRGAFSLRKSVERVADILGVSRFTVYNYLDAVREK
jgi:predicted transcriptional regulator YheO